MSQDDDMKKSPSKKMVYGDVSELGTNVYMHGIKNQSELYIKTTEAIAEYVGKKYDKNMKVLVKSMMENIPEELRLRAVRQITIRTKTRLTRKREMSS